MIVIRFLLMFSLFYLYEFECKIIQQNKVQSSEQDVKFPNEKHYVSSDDVLYNATQKDFSGEVNLFKINYLNAVGSSKQASLNSATKYYNLNSVKYFIDEKHVEHNLKEKKGGTILHYVKYGNWDVVNYPIDKFAIKNGYTPLHWAAEKGILDAVKYLIDKKNYNVNIRDRNRCTPLHYAAQNGKLDVIKYLTQEKKADVAVKDRYGETPVSMAAKNNHSDTVGYLTNVTGYREENELNYLFSKTPKEVASQRLLAKGKGEVIDRVIGIVGIAFGIKDLLQDFGILPDPQSEEFEKVLNAIGKNYAAIEEVGKKVDRNFEAMKAVFEMVSKTLSAVEETRMEMREGFKRVLESIDELKVGDKISSLATFMDDFLKNIDVVKNLSPSVRVTELERPGGILDKLGNAVASDGILHGNLYHIINQRLAIPKDSDDNVAFAAFHVLYYGTQTYVSVMFFVLDQYSFLSDYYYQKGDLGKCNEYFDLLQISFQDYKESLLSNKDKKRLIEKVIDMLSEVHELIFVRNRREDIFEVIPKRIDSLNVVTQKLQDLTLPLVGDQPEIIIRKPDFSKSEVETPIGEWKEGAKVSYAIQYKNNNIYSKVGEWSDAFAVYDKASPILKVPVDPQRRTRLIFRKFNNDKPELVGAIEGKYQIIFRDISRDVYDSAMSSNEAIAKKEIEILLSNGANISEIYEDGRRAIHAAALGGNSEIVSDFLLDNTDINIKDNNGHSPISIAAEAGYEDFVKFLIDNGADVNVKTNSDNFTSLHISAYKGDVSTVEALMLSDKIDMNAQDKVGYTPLHSGVFGGTYVLNTLISSNKTDVNAKSNEGLTPLHVASINDFEDIAEVLVETNKVDINAFANGNLTALHLASSLGSINVIKFLISQNETDINAQSADSWAAIHFAAFLKKEETALELLNVKNIEVNIKGKNNITSLHIATVTGQQNVTLKLLKKGALTEEKIQDGLTALHLAAMLNKEEIASILIENNANIEAKTANGSTPLSLAAAFGSNETVLVLLNKGADTKTRDDDGNSPIHKAVLNGKTQIVRLLIEHDPGLINLTNQNGEYPLHLAAEKNYVDILNYLADKKADLNIGNNVGATPLHYAVNNDSFDAINCLAERGADLNRKDSSSWAPLHWAAKDNHSEAISYLAEKGAELNIKDNSGWTPLHWAAKNDHSAAIKSLAEKGADLNIKDSYNLSPLHWAAKNNYSDAIKCLAEEGADLNIKDGSGNTPLHLAAKDGMLSAVKTLMERLADLNAKNDNDETPLHLAVQGDKLDVVKCLVEKGANIDAMDKNPWYGGTPLNRAAVYGYLDIVKYLVNEGANVNAKDISGTSTLHCAVVSSNLDVIKVLLEKGANINAQGMSGNTPIFDAATSCSVDVVKLLREKGANVNIKNNYNYTPKQYVNYYIIPRLSEQDRKCYYEVVKYL